MQRRGRAEACKGQMKIMKGAGKIKREAWERQRKTKGIKKDPRREEGEYNAGDKRKLRK